MIGQSQAFSRISHAGRAARQGGLHRLQRPTGARHAHVLYWPFPLGAAHRAGEPLVAFLQRGAWTAKAHSVAWALSFYAIGIAGFALLEVLSRAFYALEDTWTPVIAGTAAMLSNIALNLIFIQFIGDRTVWRAAPSPAWRWPTP